MIQLKGITHTKTTLYREEDNFQDGKVVIPQNLLLLNSNDNTDKGCQINFSELWVLPKGLQQSQECFFNYKCLNLVRKSELWGVGRGSLGLILTLSPYLQSSLKNKPWLHGYIHVSSCIKMSTFYCNKFTFVNFEVKLLSSESNRSSYSVTV